MSDPSEIYECGMCGRNGYPPDECDRCHGKAEIVPRNFTLTESNKRLAEGKEKPRVGDVGPRIIKMPGS